MATAGAILPAVVSQMALAQPDPPDTASASEGITEILITAQKRTENLHDVPSSIWVATDGMLERSQVRDFDDLVHIAPSLTISKTTQPANNSINIRGVGTYAYSIATKPSVSVIVDDVPQAFQAQAFKPLHDAAQVEVARGPQSTRFGTSASAGIINITTQAPTSVFSGGAHMLVTDDHERRLDGFVSGPVNDKLKFRLAVSSADYRGNLYNVFNGNWVGGHRDFNARAKIVWEPTEDWTITASPYRDDTESSCCTWAYYSVSPGVTFGRFGGFAAPQAAILDGITPGAENRIISADIDAQGDAADVGTGLKIERRLGEYTLASITGYSRYELTDNQDTDGTSFNWGPGGANVPGAIAGGSANGGWFTVDSLTEEIRFTSPSSGRLRYVTGFFFSDTDSARSYVRGSNLLTQDGTLTTVPPATSAYATYLAHSFDTNYALYGQVTYDVTERIGIVTGLRLNHERISYELVDRFNDVSYGIPDCSNETPSGLAASTCDSFDSTAGRIAVTYRLQPSTMLFASYDRGYKGPAYDLTSTYTTRSPVTAPGPHQGFPVADSVAAKQPIAPETVDAYQVGLKGERNRNLAWSVTAFHQTFYNFQAQSRDELTRQNVLNNIGRATSQGVEMELAARFGESFAFNASAAYNDATIREFPNAPCFSQQTAALGCIDGQQDLSGAPLFDAPEWNLAFGGEYYRSLARGYRIVVAANWHWQSEELNSLLNDPQSVQDAYGILNLRLGIDNGRWKLTAFGVNVLDESYALTRGRQGEWNINPYGASAGPVTDAVKWTPGRDSARYFGLELSFRAR